MRHSRSLLLFMVALLIVLLASCTGNDSSRYGEATEDLEPQMERGPGIVDSKTLKVERAHFHGIGNLIFENHKYGKAQYPETVALMKAMGVQSMRLWLHNDFVMSDANTFKEDDLQLMKEIIAAVQAEGIEVIAMNHRWFNGFSDPMAVPMRDLSEGSAYSKFLLNYDQTWYNLVKAFPEIQKWEIGNEWNSDVFLHPYDYKSKGMIFTFTEKANITTDMLYYASRGIHRANKDAITILGGLIDIQDVGYGKGHNFLKRLYGNIKSGDWPSLNPDEYFQTIGYHPYLSKSDVSEEWANELIRLYGMIKEEEGHDKPVYFTELGWSDYGDPEADKLQAQYMEHTVRLIEEKLPFVEAVHWFTMYNDQSAVIWGGEKEVNFGMFEEPALGFHPKEKGKMLQKLAGGIGDLYQYATVKP